MNTDFLGGIKEEELSSLSMEVLDYSERIAEIFGKIDTKFQLIDEYYESPSYVKFKEAYSSFRLNYQVVKNNIVSYSDDLIRLISKMKEGLDEVIVIMDTYTQDRKSKAKEIN